MKRIFLIFLCLFFASSLVHAKNVTWWKNEDLQISFAYSPVWKEDAPVESATVVVINWVVKDDILLASCYLQAHVGGDVAAMHVKNLHSRKKEIVKSFISNTNRRVEHVRILEEADTFIDGLPAIYLVSDILLKSLKEDIQMRAWTIITTWDQKEIIFECGSKTPFKTSEEITKAIEKEIFRVMKTLRFKRGEGAKGSE